MPDEEAVREALRQVDDPEAGMNIVDLGLVYGVEITFIAGTVAAVLRAKSLAKPGPGARL